MAMVTPSDDVYTYHFDAIGNTIAMTDSVETTVNMYAYTPFGIIAAESESVDQPFKYVGQHGVMTEDNGFYYMRARYYDPEVGRFISEDPIGFAGGDVNVYTYVGNNPVLLNDPSGLWTFQLGASLNLGGILGSTKGGGLIIGRNSQTGKYQFGVYTIAGAGAHGGATASFTVDVTVSGNDNITDVSGFAATAGGSVTVGPGAGISAGIEHNTPLSGNAKSSLTGSFGFGAGTTYEGHGYGTYTSVYK